MSTTEREVLRSPYYWATYLAGTMETAHRVAAADGELAAEILRDGLIEWEFSPLASELRRHERRVGK